MQRCEDAEVQGSRGAEGAGLSFGEGEIRFW